MPGGEHLQTIPFRSSHFCYLFRLIVMKGINPQMLTAFLFLHPLFANSKWMKKSSCQPPGDERLFKKEEMINGLTD
jgi:hypothetical protein